MDSGEYELLIFEPEASENIGFFVGNACKIERIVVHNIARMEHVSAIAVGKRCLRRQKALATQIVDCRLCGSKQYGREVVADDTVYLFGHSHIERPKPRLDMDYRQVQLRRRHSSRNGGVGIAVQHYGIECLVFEHLFDTRNHLSGLYAVFAAARIEVEVRTRYAHFVEEDGRHIGVVMLPCMQYLLFYPVRETVIYSPRQCCCLDYLRTCPDDSEYLHFILYLF